MTGRPYLEQPDFHVKAPYRAAQLLQPGNLKSALKDAHADPKKTLFGVGHGIPSTFVTKLLASTRPDYIWIDVEHAMFTRLALHDSIQAAQFHSEGKAIVIVRVGKEDDTALTTALDAGAAGIMIPHTESAEDVKYFMRKMYYPPLGSRSLSPWVFAPGVTDRSLYPDDPTNFVTASKHVAVIAQIESVKGFENIDEIASVPGVDAIMFGPGDYMAELGLQVKFEPGVAPHPEFMAAIGKLSAASNKHGVPLMGGVLDLDMVPMMIQAGFRLINITMDVWGFSKFIHGGLTKAQGLARQVGEDNATASD